jgi:integrase
MNQDRERLPETRRALKPAEPRPWLTPAEALRILEAIDCSDVSGTQTQALVSVMFYNHLRFGQALELKCGDVHLQSTGPCLLIGRKGTLTHRQDKFSVPCFPDALRALDGYIKKAHLASDPDSPMFRTIDRRTGEITSKPLSARAAHLAINHGAQRAGIEREISLHEFRVAGAGPLKKRFED